MDSSGRRMSKTLNQSSLARQRWVLFRLAATRHLEMKDVKTRTHALVDKRLPAAATTTTAILSLCRVRKTTPMSPETLTQSKKSPSHQQLSPAVLIQSCKMARKRTCGSRLEEVSLLWELSSVELPSPPLRAMEAMINEDERAIEVNVANIRRYKGETEHHNSMQYA